MESIVFRNVQGTGSGAERKCLLCKHEDQSMSLQHPCANLAVAVCTCYPSVVGQRRVDSE